MGHTGVFPSVEEANEKNVQVFTIGYYTRDKLAEALGVEIEWQEGGTGDPFATVPADKWFEACQLVRNDESLFILGPQQENLSSTGITSFQF